ncbi:MAG TPA: type II secretion system protein N [Allosphingosinicella sp.]|nr:type II secretion system protein N [Allosphingosinicella sp.]
MTIATRLALTQHRGRLLERLPRPTVYSAAELALLVLIAVQSARLIWVLLAPLGPVGEWRAASALVAPGDGSVLTGFDPFFRLSAGAGPAVVTSLNLKLYGVREDRATGRGSAIIALPDGRQMSFAVGEEIMPGVALTQVGFDNVTISRGGALEQIFLDQSTPAETVAGAPAPAPQIQMTAPPAPAAAPAPAAGQALNLQPRMAGGRVNGIIVGPGGDGGQAFRAAGFVAGDVIVAVGGQRVTSLEQARAAIGRSGGEVSVMVDRGGRAVPLRVRMNR